MGLCALGLFLLVPVLFSIAMFANSMTPVYGVFVGTAGLSFVMGLIAIALAIYARLQGAWAVVGLVTGILASLFSLAVGIGMLFLL